VLALTRIGSAIDALAQEDHNANAMLHSENLSHAECDELKGMVRATESLGHRETSSGNFEEAVGYHCQSLQMAQQIGDANKCARAVENAGAAIDSLARSLEGTTEQHPCRQSIGCTIEAAGHLEDALKCYSQDLEFAQQMNDHAGEVLALTRIGSAIDALAQEDHNANAMLHSENLSHAECDELKGMVRATESLGHRETSSGNFEEAVGYHCQSLQMAQQIGDANKCARAVENAGGAIDSLARSLEDTTEQHPRRQSIGCAIEAAGHLEDALRCYTHDLEFAQQMDDYAGEVLALTRIGSAIDALAASSTESWNSTSIVRAEE